ncbi:uncharacterized protein ACBT44_006681 [Syngnathus typhle]
MEKLLPHSLIIVLGDLNRANLAHELPRYRQHVTCPTRGAQTLDHCYTVIKDAYHIIHQFLRLRKVKEEAYRSVDRDLFRQTRNTLNREVRKARWCYGENLKRHLSANPDPSTVWKGLQSITGYKKRNPRPVKSPRLANQLNKFYCRGRARTPGTREGSAPDVPETKDQEGTGPRRRVRSGLTMGIRLF